MKTFLKTNIPKEEYYSEEFDQKIKQFLSKLKLNDIESPEPYGDVKSTCHLPDKLNEIEGFGKTFRPLITRFARKYAELTDKKISDVQLRRAWINEMYKGAAAAVHTHDFPWCDIVAVFYYRAPYNSSHFVIVHKDDINYPSNVNYFALADKSYIRVETGDLIIHDSQMSHGVSEHLSDESRICFIFDLKFIE